MVVAPLQDLVIAADCQQPSVVEEMAELRSLADASRFNLFVFLRELEQLRTPCVLAQVDGHATVGTGGVVVGYQLSDGLKALLAALRARNPNADEIEGGSSQGRPVAAHKERVL